jgi:hypothetical protein
MTVSLYLPLYQIHERIQVVSCICISGLSLETRYRYRPIENFENGEACNGH